MLAEFIQDGILTNISSFQCPVMSKSNNRQTIKLSVNIILLLDQDTRLRCCVQLGFEMSASAHTAHAQPRNILLFCSQSHKIHVKSRKPYAMQLISDLKSRNRFHTQVF